MHFRRLLYLIAGLFLVGCSGSNRSASTLVLEEGFFETETFSEKQKTTLTEAFELGFPADSPNLKSLVEAMIEKDPGLLARLLQAYPKAIPEVESILASIVREKANSQQFEEARVALAIGESIFSTHPDILATGGALRMLSGEMEAGIPLLETALTWNGEHTLANFYLGQYLIQQEDIGDRTRGKQLLFNVLESDTPEFVSRAAVGLFSSNIFLNAVESEEIFNSLRKFELLTRESLSRQETRLLVTLTDKAISNGVAEGPLFLEALARKDDLDAAGCVIILFSAIFLDKVEEYAGFLERDELKNLTSGDPLYPQKEFLRIAYGFRKANPDPYVAELEAFLNSANEEVTSLIQSNFGLLLFEGQTPNIRRALLTEFVELPVDEPARHLGAYQELLKLQPLQENYWVSQSLDKIFDALPVQTANWIFQQTKETPQLIEFLEGKDLAALSAEKKQLYLEALFRMEDADAIQSVMAKVKQDMPGYLVTFYECRMDVLSESVTDDSIEKLNNAIREAQSEGDYELVQRFGWVALQMGQVQRAMMSLFDSFSAGVPFTEEAASRLLRLTLDYGNINQTLSVADYLHKAYPNQARHRNNVAYFNFLADRKIEESVADMRELAEEFQDVEAYQLTLALGLLKMGRANEAARRLEDARIDVSNLTNRGQLIFALVLSRTGQSSIARGLLANIDRESLIPEEISLLNSI